MTRSEVELASIHDRWIRDRNRGRDDQEYGEYQESWVEEQCGGCRFWIFEFWTGPMEFTYADYPRITAPMLMLVGDRDPSCSLTDAAELYHALPRGSSGSFPAPVTR
ncbi:alpha/beta hydrolase [Saccharothrix luteola]|uniref:alpha/beta hydrolase n=1 Tax=Saccharothrix luteola TaxID=2893018 RepID=UPI001E516C32|nr:alpha/beta hydrolase [Saccharothrix luteola]MCC8245490.1 alpha/beta hydrolase [Saccharothrix luteola]